MEATYRDALPHDARLLHASRPAELLHVLAEVALAALGAQAGLALAAASASPPGARRPAAASRRDLEGRRRGCHHLGLGSVRRPGLRGGENRSSSQSDLVPDVEAETMRRQISSGVSRLLCSRVLKFGILKCRVEKKCWSNMGNNLNGKIFIYSCFILYILFFLINSRFI